MKIRPTRHAVAFFVILGAMFVASINYQSNAAWLMVFLVFTTGCLSAVHGLRNAGPAELTAGEAPLVQAGDRTRVPLTVRSSAARELLALVVEVPRDQLPADCPPTDIHRLLVPHVPIGGSARAELLLPAFARGVHRIDSFVVSTQYPLGLFRIVRRLPMRLVLYVYPSPLGLPLDSARPDPSAEAGRGAGRTEREKGDFRGLRDWQRGDSSRHIDWKAAARGSGTLLVKEYAGGGTGTAWLSWTATEGDDETRLSQLAKWVIEANLLGLSYGLRLPGIEIPPASGAQHQQACLRALAACSPDSSRVFGDRSGPRLGLFCERQRAGSHRRPGADAHTSAGGPCMILGLDRLFAGDRSTMGGMPTFSTVAWLATGMAGATVPFIGRIPWWLLAFVVGVGVWRLRRAWLGRPPPNRGTRHLLSLGVLGVLWATGNIGFGLDAAAPLFVAFLWIKLLELDAERDVLMAAFLGFFLVTGVLLTGQSLVLTLQALTAALVILGGIMWYHSPHLGGALTVDGSSTTAIPVAASRQPLLPPRQVLRTAGKVLLLVLQAAPFAVLLFLFTPRPVLQLSINSRNASSGISDRLEPGRFAANSRNDEIAFRVEFPNHDMPFIDDLYWRGIVLWQIDGEAWTRGPDAIPSTRWLVTRTLPHTAAIEREGRNPSVSLAHDVTLPANPNPWIYVLDTPVSMVPETVLLPGLVLEWREGAAGTTTYRASGNPALRPSDWGSLARRYALQVPKELDPRIRTLAQDLRSGSDDVEAMIERTQAWFTREGFLYTLEPGEMGDNGTATFLFEKRLGFCGHYAGAFCLLMRAAGIPARVVLGYRGGEINQHGGFLVVRQAHAHAWAEVWTGSETTGWRRVDLTSIIPAQDPNTGQPTSTSAAQATSAAARAALRANQPWYEQAAFQARLWYEFIESRWDRWAIGYNNELQDQFLGWLGLDEFGRWANGIGLVVGGMALVIVITFAAWSAGRLRRMLSLSAEERLYHRLLARCAAAGVARGASEGPRDHATRVCAAYPAQAAEIRDGVEAWLRMHYGAAQPDDRQLLATAAAAARRLPRSASALSRAAGPAKR